MVFIGVVVLDLNDLNVVWVGMGEVNLRNLVFYGNGVYKLIDGGVNWVYVGFEKMF